MNNGRLQSRPNFAPEGQAARFAHEGLAIRHRMPREVSIAIVVPAGRSIRGQNWDGILDFVTPLRGGEIGTFQLFRSSPEIERSEDLWELDRVPLQFRHRRFEYVGFGKTRRDSCKSRGRIGHPVMGEATCHRLGAKLGRGRSNQSSCFLVSGQKENKRKKGGEIDAAEESETGEATKAQAPEGDSGLGVNPGACTRDWALGIGGQPFRRAPSQERSGERSVRMNVG